nr:DUF6351 family protein [Micromonospora sp. DSM 115978]
QGLTTTPVIDLRPSTGSTVDIHTSEWSYSIRDRMARAGAAGNHVLLEFGADPTSAAAARAYALTAMDRWLTAVGADTSGQPLRARVAAAKPGDLGDGCYLAGAERVDEPRTYGGAGRCAERFPTFANPRLVAGAPLAMDVQKCRLKPLDVAAYPVTFTPDEMNRLRAVFSDGVCDYSKPGVGQVRPTGTWRSYP